MSRTSNSLSISGESTETQTPIEKECTYLIVGSGFVIVAHGNDSQHEIDEIKGAKEDDDHEEDDGVRPANGQHHVVNVFPIVERDKLESGQHRPGKRVKVGVTKVGVVAQAGQTHVVRWAVPAQENEIIQQQRTKG